MAAPTDAKVAPPPQYTELSAQLSDQINREDAPPPPPPLPPLPNYDEASSSSSSSSSRRVPSNQSGSVVSMRVQQPKDIPEDLVRQQERLISNAQARRPTSQAPLPSPSPPPSSSAQSPAPAPSPSLAAPPAPGTGNQMVVAINGQQPTQTVMLLNHPNQPKYASTDVESQRTNYEGPKRHSRGLEITMNILFVSIGAGIVTSFISVSVCFLLALTVVGFPALKYVLKLNYLLLPYGKVAIYDSKIHCKRVFVHIIWFPFGLMLSGPHMFFGVAYCLSLIFFPFGLQHFALARYMWYPFNAKIERRPVKWGDLYNSDYYLDTEGF